LAQGGVTGDGLYRKHGFQIAGLQSILHPPLKGKHGGVLKKHHRQCTHQTVVQRKIDLARLAGIVHLLEKRRQRLSHGPETQVFFDVRSRGAINRWKLARRFHPGTKHWAGLESDRKIDGGFESPFMHDALSTMQGCCPAPIGLPS
jgi:hypothetical protein